jgi:hypothetical protein
LADEAIKRAVVQSISIRTVKRFLDEVDLKPLQIRYWLNANPEDPQLFAGRVGGICGVYQQAIELEKKHLRSEHRRDDRDSGAGAKVPDQTDATRQDGTSGV